MKTKFQEFLITPLGSFLKVFVAAILVFIVKNKGIDGLSVNQLINSGIVATLPVIVNYINPSDKRYGAGSSNTETNTENQP